MVISRTSCAAASMFVGGPGLLEEALRYTRSGSRRKAIIDHQLTATAFRCSRR